MNEQELKTMKSRSIISVLSLLFQSSFSAVLGFGAFFMLTLTSNETILGIYGTVLASLSFFNYITNLGLAAALIQKKDVTQVDLNTAFYIQLFLVVLAVGIGWFFDEQFLSGYQDLPADTIYLYWALLTSFFLLSLKTIPSVLLEKGVEIYKNVTIQIIENTLFYGTIIVMAIIGYEIIALIAAVLIRGAIGLVLIYIMRPWAPTISFSMRSAKELLGYGIPFQGNSFLAMIKDDLLIIFLGQTIGLGNLGILMFGKKYAEIGVRIITDNFNRVAFPVFAGVQENKELLAKSLGNFLFFGSVIVFPLIIGGMFTFDSFLKLIEGYYDKWQDALMPFYFFSVATLLVSITTPFINLFNAVKRVRVSLMFMALWTALTWIIIPPAIWMWGYQSVAVAFVVINATGLFVFLKAKEIVPFSLFETLRGVFLGTILVLIYLATIRYISISLLSSPELHLFFSLVGAPIVYFSTILGMYGTQMFLEIIHAVRKPRQALERNHVGEEH